MVVQNIQKWDTKNQAREQLLEHLIRPNFLRILVKNVSNLKNQLHDAAVSTKDTLVQFIQSSNLSGESSLKLLESMFGPNSILRFSVKKNQELYKALTHKFEEEQVSQYFKFLMLLYEEAPVEEHYPSNPNEEENAKLEKEDEDNDEDDEEKKPSDENMKKDFIKTFALNQIASFP